jgi:hypothetical protein
MMNSSANHALSYVAGSVEPVVSSSACQIFDKLALNTAAAKLNIGLDEFTPAVLEQAQLPFSYAGISLPRTVALAPLAWLASQQRAAPHLSALWSRESKDSPRVSALTQSLASAHALCGNRVTQYLPRFADRANEFFTEKQSAAHPQRLFSLLSHAASAESLAKLIASAPSDAHKARLRAASAPKASLAFTTLPSSPDLSMSDFAFSNQARTVLGLNLYNRRAELCPFCKADLQLDGSHAYNCQSRKRLEITERHDSVAAVLHRFAQQLGFISHLEKRPVEGVKKRPDLIIDLGVGRKKLWVDVVVSNPVCQTHEKKGAEASLATAIHAAKRKSAKYDGLARQADAVFVPFSIELFGGMDSQAVGLVRKLIERSTNEGRFWVPDDVKRNVLRRVAIAVAAGNGSIVERSLRSLRE